MKRTIVFAAAAALSAVAPVVAAAPAAANRTTSGTLRLGSGRTVLEVRRAPQAKAAEGMQPVEQLKSYPYPRPRLAGFSPLVAITTSSKRKSAGGLDFEHTLESTYTCNANSLPGVQCGSLNPPASQNYVVGFADTGSDGDLMFGASAGTLGVVGSYLTNNVIPLGGVGGEVFALVSQPIGIYAQGLSAVGPTGILNVSAMVGHANVAAVVGPAFDCGTEAIAAAVGTPLLAFYNMVIRVDQPRSLALGGRVYRGPDVTLQSPAAPLPAPSHLIPIVVVGGLGSPVTTASYFPDFEDLETPLFPTLLSIPGGLPTGGLFYTELNVLQGQPSPTNPTQRMFAVVDTGAQSSIMSSTMAARLSLPLTPDFTLAVCGIGGLVEDVPGYYVDYVKINALGGALEFSHVPFVVLDLPSSSGGVLDGVLGMNFFWNRNIVFQPSLSGSGFVHVSDPVPFAYSDTEPDFDVDGDDSVFLLACLGGSGAPTVGPECDMFDADADGDVDLADYSRHAQCFSGADTDAVPNCGN
ncbi:MAG: clan AA aspartic protease [Planctomycetes bacterium]|nr:clan AA aspartic protease [Planctomycetota bacterium]